MTIGPVTICFACRLRNGDKCDAFPGGIPEDIIDLGFDHRKEYPGDGGVRFELEEGQEKLLKAYEESRRDS